MENSNQSKKNCNNQRALTVKFVGTQYDKIGELHTGIWTFTFNESLKEIKNRFQDGYINSEELRNIDELVELDEEDLDYYDFDENGFYEEYFKYKLRSDAWVFDETGKIVGVYSECPQIHYFPGKHNNEYDWMRDFDLYECNG
jgi:hypothetical protein